MNLDIILPPSIEVTEDGTITVDIENIEEGGYYKNIEFTLQLSFGVNSIFIDYYGEDDTYISERYEDMCGSCTVETFIQKQYEIAQLLGIQTIDINEPEYMK